jgi:hypothetical protein
MPPWRRLSLTAGHCLRRRFVFTSPSMYLIAIAWLYVTVMMAVAEAMAPNGTALGAAITLLLYGVLPLGLVLYIVGTPARKRARRARMQAELDAHAAQQRAAQGEDAPSAGQPDAGGHAPAAAQGAAAPVRKEP